MSKLPKLIEPGPNGKPLHVSCVYRWIKGGVQGVRLEAWKLPSGWHTSVDAWYRFVSMLTAQQQSHPKPISMPSHQGRAKRDRSVEAQIETVRASLRKKPSQPAGQIQQ